MSLTHRPHSLELLQLLFFDLIEAHASLPGFLDQPVGLLEDLSALSYGRQLALPHLMSNSLCVAVRFLPLLLLLLLLFDDRFLLHPVWRTVEEN